MNSFRKREYGGVAGFPARRRVWRDMPQKRMDLSKRDRKARRKRARDQFRVLHRLYVASPPFIAGQFPDDEWLTLEYQLFNLLLSGATEDELVRACDSYQGARVNESSRPFVRELLAWWAAQEGRR